MAGQFQELLIRVSGQLQGVERILAEVQRSQRDLHQDLDRVRERIASLERDLKWIGEARDKVDGRLQTGDQTFKRLEARVAAAVQLVQSFEKRLPKQETSSRSRKLLLAILEKAAPLLVGFLWWLLYHILLVGPQIAEAMKKSGGRP